MALPVELGLFLAIYFLVLLPLCLVVSPLLSLGRRLLALPLVSSSLDSAVDFLRRSVECDVVGSFPGSPLLLCCLFDEAIPQQGTTTTARKHQKRLRLWREGLKWEFYVREYRAGRITLAQFYTFTDDPRAGRETVKEDLEWTARYQEKMASHRDALAEDGLLAAGSSTRRAISTTTTSRRVVQSTAASAPVSPGWPIYPSPARLTTTTKLRGTLPRDASGNIIWGSDPLYTAQPSLALALSPAPSSVRSCFDSLVLTPGEKIKMKSLDINGRLNLLGYCIAHRVQYVFDILPLGGRRCFLDIRDGSYHALSEWDAESDLPSWVPRAVPARPAPQPPQQVSPRQPADTVFVPSKQPVPAPGVATAPSAASLKFLTASNPLASLTTLDLQHQQIGAWLRTMRDSLSNDVSVARFAGRYDDPGQDWVTKCSTAEAYCRWIYEFAVTEDTAWDTALVPYGKAHELGFKADWWKKLGWELYKMRGSARKGLPALASGESPFVKLFFWYDKVEALFPSGQPRKG